MSMNTAPLWGMSAPQTDALRSSSARASTASSSTTRSSNQRMTFASRNRMTDMYRRRPFPLAIEEERRDPGGGEIAGRLPLDRDVPAAPQRKVLPAVGRHDNASVQDSPVPGVRKLDGFAARRIPISDIDRDLVC